MKSTLKEIPITGAADYRAGSDGRIYSRQRVFANGAASDSDGWHPLRGCASSNGYVVVTLMVNGRRITKSVHKLICMAFHGLPPKKSSQVRHLDGIRTNSLPENLQWGTQEENWMDRQAHGRGMEGQKHHASKFTDEERAHIHFAVTRGLCSQKHAARVLGVHQPTIGKIVELHEQRA